MKIILRYYAVAALIALLVVGALQYRAYINYKASQRWRIENPCFNNEGKHYTR